MYYNDCYCGTAVTCRYLLPDDVADMTRHQDVQARFLCAVARTILDHPMLLVGLVGDKTKSPAYVRLDSINLDDMIEWRVVGSSEDYAATANACLSEQLDTKFTHLDTRPGWKITVLRSERSAFLDVQFVFRHTTSDGMGAKIFHQSLLEHVNNPDADPSQIGLEGSVLTLRHDHVHYPPPMERMGSFSLTPRFTVSTIWKELKPAFLAKKPTRTQLSWGPIKPGPAKTERRTIRIGADKATKILEACRAHQTTVTGLLHGIVFATLLWETRSTGYTASFHSGTAMDLRRFMSAKPAGEPAIEMDPHKTIVNLMTVTGHDFDTATVEQLSKKMKKPDGDKGMAHMEDVVWTVAKSVRAEIQAKVDQGLKNDVMALMKFVGDWRKEVARAAKKPRPETWQVTNLGVMDGAPPCSTAEGASGWRIGRAVFSVCAETARPLFVFSAMSVKGGDMCVDATWQAELNDYVEGIAERLVPDLYGWLNYIATSEWQEEGMPPAFGDDLD